MITDEMREYFEERTNKHIERVIKYADLVVERYFEFERLTEIVQKHDASKFLNPELDPYIYNTWNYKCKREGIEFNIDLNTMNDMHKATLLHVKTNRHHPEFWTDQVENIINKDNRDEPAEIVFAEDMPRIFVAEMVCDWLAMAEELGTDPYEWAEKNINIRWEFTPEQVDLIYDILDNIWVPE
jgi:hypothetical protein